MTDDTDLQTAEPAAEQPTYTSQTEGVREAGAELRRRRDDAETAAPPPVAPDRVKDEMERRIAGAIGVESVDSDTIVMPKDKPEPSIREASDHLKEMRRLKAQLSEGVKDELAEADRFEREYAASLQEQPAPDAEQRVEAQPSPEAHEQQQQLTAAEQARAQYEHATATTIQQVTNLALAEIPELRFIAAIAQQDPARVPQLMAEFAQREPGKFARFQQLDQIVRAGEQQQAQLAQARAHEQRAAFAVHAKQSDEDFAARHPEMNDPKTAAVIQAEAVELLQELGISQEEMARRYHNDPIFRSAAAQELIYRAVQYRRAQKSALNLNAHRAPVPPVQRPGVARSRAEANGAATEELSRRLSSARSQRDGLRAGADLLKARREARR
jgi:DNA-directed RNA polymerase subunit H (RpoH/RPB5)